VVCDRIVVQMVDPSVAKSAPGAGIHRICHRRSRELAAIDYLNLAPHRDLQIGYTSPTFTIPQK
jgi:hypothetical protein